MTDSIELLHLHNCGQVASVGFNTVEEEQKRTIRVVLTKFDNTIVFLITSDTQTTKKLNNVSTLAIVVKYWE